MLKRQEYAVDLTEGHSAIDDKRQQVEEGEGNLFSSELVGQAGYHVPTLDLDLECELIESTTPGHFHLYIDKPMKWEEYYILLQVLYDVGLIQKGFLDLSVARKATFLRKPGVKKTDQDAGDS